MIVDRDGRTTFVHLDDTEVSTLLADIRALAYLADPVTPQEIPPAIEALYSELRRVQR